MDSSAAELAGVLDGLVRMYRRLSPATGLSLTAVATLASLDRAGPARVTELAAREAVSQPAMTQLVSRLEAAGLAERASDPGDGRVVRVRITAAGRDELAYRHGIRAERVAELVDALPPDQRAALVTALPAITALIRLAAEPRQPA